MLAQGWNTSLQSPLPAGVQTAANLLEYGRLEDDRKPPLPPPPRLPERAAIYLAPDGTVYFGALFEGLLPVAEALGGAPAVDGSDGESG